MRHSRRIAGRKLSVPGPPLTGRAADRDTMSGELLISAAAREDAMRKLAADRAGLEILHLGDCFLMLGSVPLGRIGFVAGGEVVILPVNFKVDGQDVVFRTAAGSKLSAAGHYVGFEADSYDAATGTGWSVVVNGLAEVVESDTECARLDTLGLTSWGGTDSGCVWVRIRPVSITGRRIPAPAAGG
jgi:hypothetical protein